MTLSGQTPTSVPANMNNSMLSVMSGGGGGTQSVSSMHDLSIMGTAPSSSRLAHSKLQSSIYHHHFFLEYQFNCAFYDLSYWLLFIINLYYGTFYVCDAAIPF
jgi:hypothetical protein